MLCENRWKLLLQYSVTRHRVAVDADKLCAYLENYVIAHVHAKVSRIGRYDHQRKTKRADANCKQNDFNFTTSSWHKREILFTCIN